MKKALKLAKLGNGFVSPNPLVGCIIVKNNKIIATGYHQKFGENHAEVNAIKNCTENLEGSTLYVNLEPCCHYGKTPPCVDIIIKNKIKKVVISTLDPNPLVSGCGVKKLRDNNIDVEIGILAEEALKLNEVFFHYIKTNKPLCIVKSAISLDGKIATKYNESKWISNEKSRNLTHQYRHKYQSIMVGINTVINDNPLLTCRLSKNVSHPIRLIIDTNLKIPITSNVVKDKSSKTIIFTCNNDTSKINILTRECVDIIICPIKDNKVDLDFVIKKLGDLNISSVLVEGGGNLNFSLFKSNLVDKLKLFICPKIIGGIKSPSFVSGDGIDKLCDATNLFIYNIKSIENDILVEADVLKEV
ncbi:bifunctional diaminohydroxyphosphoribosylaminopyrimidine deaminase/5-amino-6-(5-phosphoribosylamino)uracil reductase RibD [Romboutsia maritimum]|uniref:Riboflavin biosynthesis protein RibD n=2 Tax=Romboutsia maritimum TaxID=2020948 RepID=A0A371ITK7_9FIRM|nr:bifunctional diaminohydroxyphosphoribosylaminopyrimidine deaminase/5-amino-6-(5-phosphoribosylamino)uracil reductase RibD [Romboutsia maritimum]